MSTSHLSLPHLLNPSLILGGCGLNGDVIRARDKSILHLHMRETDMDHKWITEVPKEPSFKQLEESSPLDEG